MAQTATSIVSEAERPLFRRRKRELRESENWNCFRCHAGETFEGEGCLWRGTVVVQFYTKVDLNLETCILHCPQRRPDYTIVIFAAVVVVLSHDNYCYWLARKTWICVVIGVEEQPQIWCLWTVKRRWTCMWKLFSPTASDLADFPFRVCDWIGNDYTLCLGQGLSGCLQIVFLLVALISFSLFTLNVTERLFSLSLLQLLPPWLLLLQHYTFKAVSSLSFVP